jgi:FkbM family methyltransferase
MKGILRKIVNRLPPRLLSRISSWQFSSPTAAKLINYGKRLIRNQDATISHGVGRGLKFNTGNANVGYALGTSEPEVQKALAMLMKAGDVFFDIGANVGFYTILGARLVGPSGKVVAFEPFPDSAATAQKNAGLNGFSNVNVIKKAVSNKSGNANLILSAEATMAKLEGIPFESKSTGSIAVELVSIDEFLTSPGTVPPTLVKIDVEGAEIEVLQGMSGTVSKYAPLILCENHGRNADVSRLLEEYGYWQFVIEAPGKALAEAHWDVHVVAGPQAQRHILAQLGQSFA